MTDHSPLPRPSLIRTVSPGMALLLLLGIAASVSFFGCEGRRPPTSSALPTTGTTPETATKETPAVGPVVERVTEQETPFKALGALARVFRYRGGQMRFWVETSVGAEKLELG